MNKDTKDSLVKIAKDVAVLAATSLASMAVKLIFKKRFDIQFNDYPVMGVGRKSSRNKEHPEIWMKIQSVLYGDIQKFIRVKSMRTGKE